MKSLHNLILVVTATVALTVAGSAQQQTTTGNQSNQGMQGMQGMQSGQMHPGNMNQMMQKCRNTMPPMMQKSSQARKDIAAAKASNDPAKMRAALDEADKALAGMSEHMKMCQGMMQHMQGKSGMMSNPEPK